jgi:tRNA (mo5U34)-methyltransferase
MATAKPFISWEPPLNMYTTEQIRGRVQELGDWFHNIRLGSVETAPNHFLGDYPAIKWNTFQHAIPEDLTGKSVLDIGCNAGFYSMEMKRRGAERVLGIDSDDDYLAQAQFAAEVNGLAIEFRRMNVYDVPQLGEQFDVVLFMGVLYHLRHPLLALDLLHDHVTKDLLVFQSMQRGSREPWQPQENYPFSETGVFENEDYPKMHFVEKCYSGDWTNWWIPNRSCVEAMLRSSGFTILEQPELEVYICRRNESRSLESSYGNI